MQAVQATTPVQSHPLLVIDDDPRFCEWVTDALAGMGFEVFSAFDGPSGIELSRVVRPAVIILDMIMPGADGLATCKQLKRDPLLRDIPVVGVTSSPDLKYPKQAIHAGAHLFLAKPLGANGLLHVVQLAASQVEEEPGKRAFLRFPATISARCLVRRKAETTGELAGQTGNASLGGLLLLLPETVPWGTLLLIDLKLPDESVTADGAVMWQGPRPTNKGRFHHGIRILRFPQQDGFVRYRRWLNQIAVPGTP